MVVAVLEVLTTQVLVVLVVICHQLQFLIRAQLTRLPLAAVAAAGTPLLELPEAIHHSPELV